MVDGDAGLFAHFWFGVKRHTHAGQEQHGNVVGTIAHGKHMLRRDCPFPHQAMKNGGFRVLAQHGFAHDAGELAIFDDEVVCLILVEAKAGGDRGGKLAEAAGHQRRVGAMGLHGRNQLPPARNIGNPLTEDCFNRPFTEAAHQRHTLAQRLRKIQFAPHGAIGDRLDGFARARQDADFVDAFLVDHGRIHIGDEQPLAAVRLRHHGEVDGQSRNGGAEFLEPLEGVKLGCVRFTQPAQRRGTEVAQHRHDTGIDCTGARGCYENGDGIHMVKSVHKRALLIAGPTASGKSALALKMARERSGIIINADALQVYRELRILSARPSPAEEAEAPHRLYGHVSGRDTYSVSRWLADAMDALEAAWRDGLLPIVSGGTGLYFKALEQGLAEIPPIDPDIRQKWRNFKGDLHGELLRLDPHAATLLKSNDRQRIIRSLEVIESTGRSLAQWQADVNRSALLADVTVERIFLNPPREELYARAEARFDQMLASGAMDEVRALLDADPALPIMKAIGVPELRAHLRGEISLEEAVTAAKTATRHYIKRQLTWWRGQMKGWELLS